MVNKLFVLALVFIFTLAPAVLAVQTQINIKTIDHKDVTVAIIEDSEQYKLIKSYPNIFSGIKGEISVTHDGEETAFKIKVIVKEANKVVVTDTFASQSAGGVIDLEVFPAGYDPDEEKESDNSDSSGTTASDNQESDAEETSEETEEVTKEDAEKSGVTGFSFLGDIGKGSRVFYVIAVILIVGVLGFFIYRRIRAGPPHVVGPKETKPKKSMKEESSFQNLASAAVAGSNTTGDMNAIEVAERKIKEAQAEINKIKNKSRIDAAERKLRDDQEALERLKKGED